MINGIFKVWLGSAICALTTIVVVAGIAGCSSLVDLSETDSKQSADIRQSIDGFWRASDSGGFETAKRFVQTSNETFWRNCIGHSSSNSNLVVSGNVSYQDSLGDGGLSITERENREWLVEDLSTQIRKNHLVLVKRTILRSNDREAVAKIDWSKAEEKNTWISQVLLLRRYDDSWRIILIADPGLMSKIDSRFAASVGCT